MTRRNFHRLPALFVFAFLLTASTAVNAQKKLTIVGIQYKPIFPVSFLGTGQQLTDMDSVRIGQELTGGFNAGMVIRKNFSDLMALEFGINYTKRRYTISVNDGAFSGKNDFRIIGYELPVNFLVFIQLGEQLYMNASMGGSADIFASNDISYSYYYKQLSVRNHLIQPALNANVGWEFRTEKNGYIYLGASYNRPFNFIYHTTIHDTYNGHDIYTSNKVLGSYLTVDLRYYFHEDPSKRPVKTTIE